MFCKYCGHELLSDDKFCPFCGKKVDEERNTEKTVINTGSVNNDGFKKFEDNNQHVPYYVNQPNGNIVDDSGSFGWAVLGFFIPICGLILYIVWRNTKPKCAKNAGIGALVYVCIAALFILLSIILSALTLKKAGF